MDQGLATAAPDDPASRQFTRVFVAVLLAGILVTSIVAVVVDPLHAFGTGRIPSVLTSEREDKPEAFLHLARRPEVLVLGSSRVMKLRPACIEQLTGLPAFNFGLSNSRPEDWDAVMGFVRATSPVPVKRLIIGVDVESFDGRAEPDQRLQSSQYLRSYVAPEARMTVAAAARALFGWQAFRYGLSSVWHYARRSPREPDSTVIGPDGLITYTTWEDQMRKGTFSSAPLANALKQKLAAPRAMLGYDELSPLRVRLFEKLVRTARASGVQIDVFIPPISAALAAVRKNPTLDARARDVDALLDRLAREGVIRYFRVDRVEDFGGDPAGYFDGAHMTEANTDRLLLALFGRSHGCGW